MSHDLFLAARDAMTKAYAPYSKFPVGAALRTEDGRELAFRYYDPRVLNVYLPTCTADEFHTLLGPLTALVAEQPGGGSLRMFGSDGTGMRVRELPVEGMPYPVRAGMIDTFADSPLSIAKR